MRTFANCPVIACTWVFETSLPPFMPDTHRVNGDGNALLAGIRRHQERMCEEHLATHDTVEFIQAIEFWRTEAFQLVEDAGDCCGCNLGQRVEEFTSQQTANVMAHVELEKQAGRG